MQARIEHLDDLALDLQAMRHVDRAGEQAADLLRDGGLAVARRAVEQERAAELMPGPSRRMNWSGTTKSANTSMMRSRPMRSLVIDCRMMRW